MHCMGRFKIKIRNWVLKHLLNAILIEDVVTISPKVKKVFVNGRELEQGELESIVEEAKFIEKTRLWTLMQGTLNAQAKDKLFNHAVSPDDLFMGKAMLYNLDIQNKIIEIFKNIK